MSARTRIVGAALAASLVIGFLPSSASALSLASACRKVFGKAGTALVTSVLSAEQACLTASAQGKLAAGTICSEAGPAITRISDAKTQAKLTAAIARARAAVEKRCTGVDVSSPAPSGLGITACGAAPVCAHITVQDVASLADCLECAHVSAAHEILATQHADSTKPATGPPSSGGSPRRVSATGGTDGNGCGGAQNPCRTIQYAVNASATNDEILVAEGTYTYDAGDDPCAQYIDSHAIVCVLNKKLTIRGGYADGVWTTPDPEQNPTVIDGADQRRGVLVQRTSSGAPAAGLVMEGFTVRRGRVQGAATGGDAKTFAFGAGLLADFSTIELRDMIFRDNQALGGDTSSAYGGAAAGGGVALRACSSTTVENVTFENNRAEGGSGGDRGGFGIGGGLFTFETTLAGADLAFTDNRAIGGNSSGNGIAGGERADGQGGGMAIQEGSDAVVTRVTAIDNQAIGGNADTNAGGAFGGGLYAEKATFAFSDTLVEGNVAVAGNGANGGFGSGGGVMTMNVVVTIDRARIVDNRSSGGDGSANAGACGGGGLYLAKLGGTASVTMRNTVIADNLTEMGSSGAPPGGGGGGLFLQGLQATIEHATIANNHLGSAFMQGIGVVIISGTSNADVDIRHSIISNHSGTSAAALHVQPSNAVTLVRGIFAGNVKDTNSDGSVGAPGTFNGLATMLATGSLGYVSPGAPEFDYHVGPSSPAVDQATSSNMTVDVDGQTRTGTRDIGADEVGP